MFWISRFGDKEMIIVQLLGGLGNQMFQYAFGRQLAIINSTCLKVDLRTLNDNTPRDNFTYRNYELDCFNLNAEIAGERDLNKFVPVKSKLKRIINRVKKFTGIIKFINEDKFSFQPEVLTTGKNIYLKGYWQSEKYFGQISEKIKEDFTLKECYLNRISLTESIIRIKEVILKTDSVAVHFRRGDYVTNPLTSQHHGVCSNKYYQDAICLLKSKIGKPHFFLFSDEPEWLKTNFTLREPFTIIENNPGFVDLYLMSLCKHNIIANSSFSWWGAWLNNNPEKIIIAPYKWFREPAINTHDLIPEGWIRL